MDCSLCQLNTSVVYAYYPQNEVRKGNRIAVLKSFFRKTKAAWTEYLHPHLTHSCLAVREEVYMHIIHVIVIYAVIIARQSICTVKGNSLPDKPQCSPSSPNLV